MTEEQIEIHVEKRVDALDRAFLSSGMTQEEYDRSMREIDEWAKRQGRKSTPIVRLLAALSVAVTFVAPAAAQRSQAQLLAEEQARINSIPAERRVLSTEQLICTTSEAMHEVIVAALNDDARHMMSIPDCIAVTAVVRVGVLNHASAMVVRVRILEEAFTRKNLPPVYVVSAGVVDRNSLTNKPKARRS